MTQRPSFSVSIVALVWTTAACGGAHRSPDRATGPVACVPVRVLDEEDRPLAGVSLEIHAEAWVGPEGAFYLEAGQPIDAAGGLVRSAADGTACVPDPEPALVTMREHIANQSHGSLAVPYAGGLGQTRVGGVRRTFLRAEAVNWPVSISSISSEKLAVGITAVGPRTIRLGPARTAFVDVISACPPSTLSAVASAGAAGATGAPTIQAWNRVRFRFDGLGPFSYGVTVDSCEGRIDGMLDVAEHEGERHPISTLETVTHASPAPIGKPVQLVAASTRGCVVTDAGELGCFQRVYQRTDLQPPRLLASWLDRGKLGSPGTTAQIAGVGPSWCARTIDGEAWCWGDSAYGMFGDNRRHVDANAAVRVPLPSRAIDLAVSGQHACARVETGAVLCWGWNGYGQLGLGERKELVTVPRDVPGFRGATMLALSRTSTCAVLAGGDVACAGRDKFAEIGVGPDGIERAARTPRRVPGVAAGARLETEDIATFAVDGTGRHLIWGPEPGPRYGRCELRAGTIECSDPSRSAWLPITADPSPAP
ncbi:hypothetical protein BH11MYX1_BH11MYX1_42950 [soil metagenome]